MESPITPQKSPRKVKPTEKQIRFVQGKMEGKSTTQAALDAGYSPNTAKNPTKDILAKPGVQEYANKLGALLEARGVTDELITQKLEEGLASHKGGMNNDPDYKTRLDYLKYMAELKGHKVTDKLDLTTDGKAINIKWGE